MKHQITLSLAILLLIPGAAAARSVPRVAAPTEITIRKAPDDPGRYSRLLRQIRAARGGGVGAQVVADARSSDTIVFPAAGNVRGAGGEFFRSDVTLISYDETGDQEVLVQWLQNGVPTATPPSFILTLRPNTYYNYPDFVGEVLGIQNQLGSLVMIPVSGNDFDLNASIDGFSRIWTNQPNAAGTVAQPFEPLDPFVFAAVPTASIMGLRQDSAYRSNYGLLNLDDQPLTFQIAFLGATGSVTATVTVPPFSMVHRAVPAGNYGALTIEVTVSDGSAVWATYGTTNDNVTGDGWVSVGSMLLLPAELPN